ncbi:hypothetical protein Cri9333_0544 [Crinalium epipsammum PCC 9333]|uniref:DarT domain-containing protein n=1 Tax=Crinalium epipsammum PCC 9333 TaxID=1173022 RepID=K9VWG0_9CYAN|nr:DUF4433 domain-containing protein [Crinalium epipsammum]AFZ11495.1 hypothetical protein Cri9333_0544 [Crinalium epipsammum PCC 9333]
MSQQLRYLLHGNKAHYDDIQIPLYITSQDSTLWQNIGLQVLDRRGEAWRLIDSVFIDSIPPANFQRLGIQKLLAEQVVDDLIRPTPEYVDGSLLNKSERYELLAYISQKPSNEELWKSLRLHENANDSNRLECIEVGRVYLENSDFPLDERLKNDIVLIRRNTEIQQNWIPLWTPDAAIAKILSLPTPHNYYDLILDALQQMGVEQKQSLKADLQQAKWLPPNGYSPQDILKLPDNLEQNAQLIADLDNSKHPQQVLPESVRTSRVYHWVKSLFTLWNAETVIKKILAYPQKNLEYCLVILNAFSVNLSNDLKLAIATENWLFLRDSNTIIAPDKVVEIIPKGLKKHLLTLVALIGDNYIDVNQLNRRIVDHNTYQILCEFFSKWKEDEVLDIVLNQDKPHHYSEIILDALTVFLPHRNPNTSNKDKLKNLAWLVDEDGKAVYAKNVLYYTPNLKEDIEQLLLSTSSSYVAFSQLARQIRDRSDCLDWLIKNDLVVVEDRVLRVIGELFNGSPEYQLGEFASVEEFPLDQCLEAFKYFNVNFLPAWNFAKNLSKEKFRRYLLPNLLDKMDVVKLRDLLILLSSPNPQVDAANAANVEVFNTYLRLAINYETFSTEILPEIRLLNRRGQWKYPNQLTGENANIDYAYLLDEEQFNIISSFLNLATQVNNNLPELNEGVEDGNSENSFDILISYFREWESYCPLEPIGAFLTLFKSSGDRIKEQAEFYLGKRNIEGLRKRLLANTAKPIRVFQVHVGQAGNRMCWAISLLGTTFEAELANLPNPPHFFVNEGGLASNTRRLELLHIQPEQLARGELIRILKDSTKVLLTKVYGVELNSIEVIWEDLLNSDQLDIQVAENYLIESAPHVLRMLGIKDDLSLSTRLILTRLKELDDLRHEKAEYKQQGLEKEQQDTEKIVQEKLSKLSNLLKENEDVKNVLLNSVRTKIGQHGYRQQSIPFELFQNADDAVIELQEMLLPRELENERKEFVVIISTRKLSFIHLGRPIGCFQLPDHPEDKKKYRNKGYDRDLEKMLTFNISDKGDGVTGMFGLGFKSVYLLCKRPRILSKRLGFAVEGGLLPSRLSPEETRGLQKKLDFYTMPSDATVVELELDENIHPQEIIREFKELANILTIFSRAITKCRFIKDDTNNYQEVFTWERQPFLGIQDIEVNRITINGEDSLRLCLRTASGSALLLDMTERDGRLSCTTPDVPTFWVTAPTQEKVSVGFILNAAFKVTTGRTKLDPTGDNQELAATIGIALGQLLKKLCESNWEELKVAFGFSSVDSYSFWEFLWKELAVNWQKLDINDERCDLISRILGGTRGMGYLITHSKAIPNGLYGHYRQLISLHSDINYFKVTGKLAEPSCFCEVAQWSHFQQSYQDNLISHTRWEEVRKLIGVTFERKYTYVNLRLIDVLQKEIGAIEPKVTPEQARQVGNLISKTFLDSFSTPSEHFDLQSFLPKIRFNSQGGKGLPSEQLLSGTSDQAEEKRLVGFAPDDRLLHSNYIASAIDFFYACRFRRDSVAIEVLVQWALQAETTTKRNAVHHYLLHGDHRDELARRLHENLVGSWMVGDRSIVDTLELMVLIGIKREEDPGGQQGNSNPDEPEQEGDVQDYDPNIEVRTRCTSNDFSLSRSLADFRAFTEMLLDGIERQRSYWKGYIYHFTHVENAASILQSEKLHSRNGCNKFSDSAGAGLIAHTSNDVKNFARFYLRPKTPTQWHNEGLGKRQGQIHALCPVPIFFRLNLSHVLDTHGSKCGVSSGNLAASGSYYGNSREFLEHFDVNNVYCTIQAGKETFLRASQQEFVVHDYLDIAKLSLDDITIICRNEQDKATLLCLIGTTSKYANRVFTEKEEAANCREMFDHENPFVEIKDNGKIIEAKIEKYDAFGLNGQLILSFAQTNPLDTEICSKYNDISKISLGQAIRVNATRNIQLQFKPNTKMSVYFQEHEKEWLVYTNEHRNS